MSDDIIKELWRKRGHVILLEDRLRLHDKMRLAGQYPMRILVEELSELIAESEDLLVLYAQTDEDKQWLENYIAELKEKRDICYTADPEDD